ncbi:MAG: DUF2293 domain-containing protein [Saprospiraceae bacterium]|nr:DUF2293 domain-containing protein [Saprospiraceae bacterium]
MDKKYVAEFATQLKKAFPGCQSSRAKQIAEHACRKYTGRVGRSSAAKSFDPEALLLAVAAHLRHTETEYDELLMKGYDRREARSEVQEKVEAILEKWSK